MKEIGEQEIISAYQNALNNSNGDIIMQHLRDVARMDAFDIDPSMSDETLRSYHYMAKLVNYIQYMRTRENFYRPEGKDEPIPEIIQNKV